MPSASSTFWFVAGNLVRDVAALNNREMLPWDVWGAMPRQDSELDLAFFDRLTIVSREPDAHVDELSALYRDERVSVPGTVFNACSTACRNSNHRVGERYRAALSGMSLLGNFGSRRLQSRGPLYPR
jgi:hypothetical protein